MTAEIPKRGGPTHSTENQLRLEYILSLSLSVTLSRELHIRVAWTASTIHFGFAASY